MFVCFSVAKWLRNIFFLQNTEQMSTYGFENVLKSERWRQYIFFFTEYCDANKRKFLFKKNYPISNGTTFVVANKKKKNELKVICKKRIK